MFRRDARPGMATCCLMGLGCLLWCVVCVVGFASLVRYERIPGRRAESPETWPIESSLAFVRDRRNVVVAVHPCCPCSRDTLEQLATVVAGSSRNVVIHVLAYEPESKPPEWPSREMPDLLEGIPDTHIVADCEGELGRRFGVRTSGHVLLFDASGRLRFSGGITSGRGCAGTNPSARAFQECLEGASGPVTTEVFGCPIAPE